MLGQTRLVPSFAHLLKLAASLAAAAFAIGCGGGGSAPSTPPVHGKWTVLVYMNAANDLDVFSPLNIIQMQQAATASSDVRFVVQWKQSTKVSTTATFNGTRRYLITPSLSGGVTSQVVQDLGLSVDMGIPGSLKSFIQWGKAHYPADHTAVILWDHGNGWLPASRGSKTAPPAFSYDDQTGHSIQIWQLNQAFQGLHVDIAAFDCSLMQMAEVAYQFVGKADYVAASEESPPGSGYPYQRVLGAFTATPDASPRTLSKAFVDGMMNEPTYNTMKVEESVIDTTQMANVASAAAALRVQLVANASSLITIAPALRTSVQSYEPTVNRFFFDATDLCNQLNMASTSSGVQSACVNLSAAVSNAVIWEGHNSNSPGSHGLGIDFSPSSSFTKVSADYHRLSWDTASGWSQWLAIAP